MSKHHSWKVCEWEEERSTCATRNHYKDVSNELQFLPPKENNPSHFNINMLHAHLRKKTTTSTEF
jgi:hypothetical protein